MSQMQGKKWYVNTGKFRINANKGKVDIWVIFQCPDCKSTWNLTLYERINPGHISKVEYEKYQNNDIELMKQYAYDPAFYRKNKAEASFGQIEYEVKGEVPGYKDLEEGAEICIKLTQSIDIRIDTFLSDNLLFSRNEIKKMHQKEILKFNKPGTKLSSSLTDGLIVSFSDIINKSL